MTSLTPGVEGELAIPAGPPRSAVLVLSGSSGRVDTDRAHLLARHGALALALRWFGGAGQPSGICEVPLETFTAGLDLLRQRAPSVRLGIVGTSKGAEAALLVAQRDPLVQAVVAVAPTGVVWANVGPGLDGISYPYRSSWTWRGAPLPYVTWDEGWQSTDHTDAAGLANLTIYQDSLRLDPARTATATIDVGSVAADLLLVAGGSDLMWPSLSAARQVEAARLADGRQVEVVSSPGAGHRITFPGEPALPPSSRTAYGGTESADRELGELAWPRALDVLGLAPTTG